MSAGLRSQGYALMCVAYPRSDAVLELVEVRASTPILIVMDPLQRSSGLRSCATGTQRAQDCTGSSAR